MTAYIILGAAALALTAGALCPVKLEGEYAAGKLTLLGRAGPVRLPLVGPGRRGKRPERPVGAGRGIPAPALWAVAAKSAGRAGGVLLRRVRVEVLRLRFVAGGDDPFRAVMAYARAGMAMEAIAARIEGADLSASVDLEGGAASLECRICLGIRLWGAAEAAVCFGTDFLREYFRYRRQHTEG